MSTSKRMQHVIDKQVLTLVEITKLCDCDNKRDKKMYG